MRSLPPTAVQPGEPFLERVLSDAEHIAALAAQDTTDELAAVPRPLDDLLDRNALLRQFQNGLVGITLVRGADRLDSVILRDTPNLAMLAKPGPLRDSTILLHAIGQTEALLAALMHGDEVLAA